MKKIFKFISATALFTLCFSITAYAFEKQDFTESLESNIANTEVFTVQQVKGWVRGKKTISVNKSELVEKDHKKPVTESHTEYIECAGSELSSAMAGIKAKYGYVSGSINYTVTNSTTNTYRITYKRTVSYTEISDIYATYKYTYVEALYYNDGKVQDVNPYGYLVKKTFLHNYTTNIRHSAY